MQIHIDGESCTAKTHFTIPYVKVGTAKTLQHLPPPGGQGSYRDRHYPRRPALRRDDAVTSIFVQPVNLEMRFRWHDSSRPEHIGELGETGFMELRRRYSGRQVDAHHGA